MGGGGGGGECLMDHISGRGTSELDACSGVDCSA